MRYSLLTPGGYDESCSIVVISVIIVVGITSEGIRIVVVVVEVVMVEVVKLVVSGMKSVSIFIFRIFSSDYIRPRGSVIKVQETRLSSEKSSAEPT